MPIDADVRARILKAIRDVPRGQVAAYGEIARRAGLPGRARLVARVLADPASPRVPWHRIVRSDGRIAFPAGTDARAEQARRLGREGVVVENGRVLVMRPARTLDEALWGPQR